MRYWKWMAPGLLLAASASAEGLGESIDRFIQPRADAGQFNGVVLLGRGDQVLYQRAFGYADVPPREPMSVQHRFNIGSIGKEFSGAAIALLARSGKLRYSDKLARHVDGLPDWAKRVSLQHLLTYSSGLPPVPEGTSWNATLTNDVILKWLKNIPSLQSPPGTAYTYDVYSPFLLALVIERASGSSFDQFLHDAIFAPAGMTSTALEQQMGVAAPLRSKAFDADGTRDYFPLRLRLPLVYTTAADLFSWARTLRNGRLLPAQELNRLSKPLTDSLDMHGYSEQQTVFGNVEREHGALVKIKHQGSHNNFNSLLFIDLKAAVTIIVLTNHAKEGELYGIADRVYELALSPQR